MTVMAHLDDGRPAIKKGDPENRVAFDIQVGDGSRSPFRRRPCRGRVHHHLLEQLALASRQQQLL